MALPSQSARATSSARSHMHRRRRTPFGSVVVLGVAGLLVAGVAWGGWTLIGDRFSGPPAEPDTGRSEARSTEVALGSSFGSSDRQPVVPSRAADGAVRIEMERGVVDQGVKRVETPPPVERESPQQPPKQPTGQPQTPAVHPAIEAAERLIRENDLVGARDRLSAALQDPGAPESIKADMRRRAASLNDDILFSPKLHPREPRTRSYTVASGDSLVRIASREKLLIHHRLIARVNRLARPDMIQQGQRLKLVQGPFHAIVRTGAFRLDLYHGQGSDPKAWLYVRSFPVGLGEGESTPHGRFIVRQNSKLENPAWVNPRTGQRFAADDPMNPIGERWVGLDGLDDAAVHVGYGLHGTIEPDSIGQMRSMGCVRMHEGDIEFVYDLLEEGVSMVIIGP